MLSSTNIPFGPAKSWTFGNGQAITRAFDLDGHMTGNAVIKGTVVEFFSAKDYLGPGPEVSLKPIASNSPRD